MAKNVFLPPERGGVLSSNDQSPPKFPMSARWKLALLAHLIPILLVTPAARSAAQETWTPTSLTGAPSPRARHVAVWTGSRMIIWGGDGEFSPYLVNTGGVYAPATNTWTATSLTGAPTGRDYRPRCGRARRRSSGANGTSSRTG
jgi:hypothetical protein